MMEIRPLSRRGMTCFSCALCSVPVLVSQYVPMEECFFCSMCSVSVYGDDYIISLYYDRSS